MIEVKNLSKHYRLTEKSPGLSGAFKSLFAPKRVTKKAVDDIGFQIESGEMVGYIGANGAGKSTTIKMLCGILTPTTGEILVDGIVPYKERNRNAKNIGAVFGQRSQLFWDIAVRESYDLLKHIYDIPEDEYRKTLQMFTEVLELEPLLGTPVRQLSLGQKMRCELAAAFLHNPGIVYLDEPTIGLDVAVKSRIRQFIKEMNRMRGTTVILTTHDMQDIEEICSRIIIIDAGKVLYDGSLQSIKDRYGDKRVIHFELELEEEFQLPPDLAGKAEWTPGETGTVSVAFSNHVITAADVISEMLRKYRIRDLTISDSKIETIVQDIYCRGI